MKKIINIVRIRLLVFGMMLSMATLCAQAQEDKAPADSIGKGDKIASVERIASVDSVEKIERDSKLDKIEKGSRIDKIDSAAQVDTIARDSSLLIPPSSLTKKAWTPNPQRALWLALVIPGGGQIYNRKFWKLPIFYGGMMGCIYAMTWNNMMYKDYSQAYLDIMDSDPTTESYNKFLHLGTQITSANEERYKKIFKSRKDKYRRWRDLSVFCLIGVYALSVIDAYVDAELSEFDISSDLSLRIEPAVFNNNNMNNVASIDNSSIGLQCSLNF